MERNSRPIGEMRQLVRVLVKLLPGVDHLLSVDISGMPMKRIEEYLLKVLGDVPQLEWGRPCCEHLANLFSWALGRAVSEEDAMKCFYRQPNKSWAKVDQELHSMGKFLKLNGGFADDHTYHACTGLFPEKWTIPLNIATVQMANEEGGEELLIADAILGLGEAAGMGSCAMNQMWSAAINEVDPSVYEQRSIRSLWCEVWMALELVNRRKANGEVVSGNDVSCNYIKYHQQRVSEMMPKFIFL